MDLVKKYGFPPGTKITQDSLEVKAELRDKNGDIIFSGTRTCFCPNKIGLKQLSEYANYQIERYKEKRT